MELAKKFQKHLQSYEKYYKIAMQIIMLSNFKNKEIKNLKN